MPAHAYKTYEISSPLTTHYRPATCAEVQCRPHVKGWCSPIDERTDLGRKHAHIIRTSKRKFTERRDPSGVTVFEFEAGQRCFAKHQLPVGRPELFVVRDGDHRGNPRGTDPRRHTRPEFWVEDFAEHQQKIADEIQKG